MNKSPMTVAGAEKLREELERLKYKVRPQIVKAIAEARAHGDLKENAEYHAAKEQQSLTEGRIQEIEGKLSVAEVIDVTRLPNQGRVIFGVTVTISNVDTEEELRYQIVGEDEADIKQGRLSINSPIARALIGKNVDEAVVVDTPGGSVEYEIVSVEHL